jgi:hypothetical protein
VHWLGHRHGIAIDTPERHPFNPIALSRLAWATAPTGTTPSRHACETILRHVWIGGGEAEDPERIAALRAELAPGLDPASDEAKQRLRAATDDALVRGVFGVPTLGIDGKLFWGSTPSTWRRISSAASPGSPRRTGSAKARRAPASSAERTLRQRSNCNESASILRVSPERFGVAFSASRQETSLSTAKMRVVVAAWRFL